MMQSETGGIDLVALVEELVDAHVDTIEMCLERDRAWDSHVLYLQALVRESQKRLAVLCATQA